MIRNGKNEELRIFLLHQTFFLTEVFSSENLAANLPSLLFRLNLQIPPELELASNLLTIRPCPGKLSVDELLSRIPKRTFKNQNINASALPSVSNPSFSQFMKICN